MTRKWIRDSFLIAISFFAFAIVFSCKNQNTQDKPKEKPKFLVTFEVQPKEEGSIEATIDGKTRKSGIMKVEENKDVLFTVTITHPELYEMDDWEKAEKDTGNPLIARLKVTKDTKVVAKLKKKDPNLVLSSLKIHNKDVDVSNPSALKVEVENYAKTLKYSDVQATFTYGKVTTPEAIKVEVDKDTLLEGKTLVKLSVPALKGKYQAWTKDVEIERKVAPAPQNPIPQEINLEAIEVALVAPKDNTYEIKDYVPVKDFSATNSGPYTAQDAQTAYIMLKPKATKPTDGDYVIKLTNTTTYTPPITFSRKSATDPYFEAKMITLSKGYNILELEVKNHDGTKQGVYTVVLKYDGGPDPLAVEMQARKMLKGIYCPAQRKPLEGETPDYMWVICFAGWCPACPRVLNLAGIKGDKVASKYRSKGLRVVAIDSDGTKKSEATSKWKASGADYYLYDKNMNCLISLYEKLSDGYYPFSFTIKDGEGKALTRGGEVSGVEITFGF